MEVKALSASRVKEWLTCKYKYGCRYHNFHPEVKEHRADYFKLGTAVHSALEYAGQLVLENSLKKFSKEDILDITKKYFEAASKEGLNDQVVLDEGLTLLLHKLNTFEFGYKIISLEKWFNETIDGVPVVGAMDRVVEKGPKTLCVIDYKTSRSAMTDDELKSDIQVGIYDLVSRKQYPEYSRYVVCLDYLRLFPKQVSVPKIKRQALKVQLKVVYEDILKANKEDLTPTLHQFCPWCSYVTVCPAIKEIEEELGSVTKDSLVNASYEDVADVYTKSKLLEKVYKDLKDAAYTKLVKFISNGVLNKITTKNKGSAYECGDYVISMRQNAYVSYDLDSAYELLGSDRLIRCVDLNRKKFEAEAKRAGISEEDLAEIRNINFSKPIISVKKKK